MTRRTGLARDVLQILSAALYLAMLIAFLRRKK